MENTTKREQIKENAFKFAQSNLSLDQFAKKSTDFIKGL
jgi:hypothetical protein